MYVSIAANSSVPPGSDGAYPGQAVHERDVAAGRTDHAADPENPRAARGGLLGRGPGAAFLDEAVRMRP